MLAVVHGQATVVHGARCVGHARCAEACPTGAVAVTLGDVRDRRDLPALTETLEAKGQPGLYLAGEITGFALVRTAIAHGTAVADEIADRARGRRSREGAGADVLDLVVVGAGPAGIACALRAKEKGLAFVVLEQETLGGTVAKYPRRKLVMTQPVRLPLHGLLRQTEYTKEELLGVWEDVVRRHALPVLTGVAFESLERDEDGTFTVETREGALRARAVVLAIGRRGRPRKLGVPGEELAKVAYHLVDAESYRGRRVLVVGGGDSAVEAAVGLARQPDTDVTLSYRRAGFFRIKARNEERLEAARSEGRLRVLLESEVTEIGADHARIRVRRGGGDEDVVLPNDDVFVLAGGVPPYAMLERAGVSFDPADRDPVLPPTERGTGLLVGVGTAFGFALAALAYVLARADYYLAPGTDRLTSPWHETLRPAGGVGLAFGLLAGLCLLSNLTYLLRRSRWGRRLPFGLRSWMTAHLLTGLLALLAAGLHAGLAPRDALGGHALLALGLVVLAGAFGRYLYALVPRAANGREMELDEVRAQLAVLSGDWDRVGGGFADRVRREIEALVEVEPWRRSLPRRLLALLTGQRRLRRALARLGAAARAEGIPQAEAQRVAALARRAHRAATAASHYEDVRGAMASWRYVHRWLALLLVLLVGLHVVTAFRYADLRFEDVPVLGRLLGGAP